MTTNTTLRLTRSDRDSVVAKALEHKFSAREKALLTEEHKIAAAAYALLVPATIRAAAKSLPTSWVRTSAKFWIAFGPLTMHVRVAEPVPVPQEYWNRLGIVKDAKLNARAEKWASDVAALKEERGRIRVDVQALVDRHVTLRQLADTWPEGKRFYTHLKPREKSLLPVVQIEQVNAALGLRSAS